jgi:hypothetical protein
MTFADIVGLIGVGSYLLAHGLLQLGRISIEDGRYTLLNLLGAVLILYSLIYSFNLPSFVTQLIWGGLTILGYVRARSKKVAPAS